MGLAMTARKRVSHQVETVRLLWWNISTTYNPNIENWYSIPVFLQDEELQILDNHVISNNIELELIGTEERELFTNPNLDHFSSWFNVGFPGFRGENITQKDDGILRETGENTLECQRIPS